jgi:integrase
LQQFLGHASIKTTMDRYGKWCENGAAWHIDPQKTLKIKEI